MTIEEIHKKVNLLRAVSEAALKYLHDHAKLMDQAFDELKQVTEAELDVIYDKIHELDQRMDKNGLSR